MNLKGLCFKLDLKTEGNQMNLECNYLRLLGKGNRTIADLRYGEKDIHLLEI